MLCKQKKRRTVVAGRLSYRTENDSRPKCCFSWGEKLEKLSYKLETQERHRVGVWARANKRLWVFARRADAVDKTRDTSRQWNYSSCTWLWDRLLVLCCGCYFRILCTRLQYIISVHTFLYTEHVYKSLSLLIPHSLWD